MNPLLLVNKHTHTFRISFRVIVVQKNAKNTWAANLSNLNVLKEVWPQTQKNPQSGNRKKLDML